MGDAEELAALRRMADLEARSGSAGTPVAAQPQQMNALQARMGIRGMRAGQGANDILPNMANAVSEAGYNVGAGATDLGTKMGLPPEGAAALGYGANVATDVLPMFAGGLMGAASKAPEAMQGAGRWLMGKALKPSVADAKSGKGERAIELMLQDGYNPTRGGVDAMKGRVSELGDQVEGILANSTAELDKHAMAERLLGTYDKYLLGSDPTGNAKIIGDEARTFLNRPGFAGHDTVPIQLAQDVKQQMGRELGSASYGMGLKPEAERDARKALVRAMKEDISAAEPAVAPLNSKESELINAIKIAQHRAAVQGNTNPMGLALLAKDPMAGLGFLADKSTLAKSLAARLLYSQSQAAPASAGRVMGGYLGAQSGLPPQ